MIIPQFSGRLGNLMFQTAYVHYLAHENNDKYTINSTQYDNTVFRDVDKTISQPSIPFTYAQDYKFVYKYEHEIRKLFSYITEDSVKVNNRVIMHFRRTDYLYYPPELYRKCTLENYYLKAMSMIPDIEHKEILVFSDDISMIKEEFNDHPNIKSTVIFVEGQTELEDMSMMTTGEYFIGGNSTFAWWGWFMGNYDFDKTYFTRHWTPSCTDTIKHPQWILVD